jgi:hypothetical protein
MEDALKKFKIEGNLKNLENGRGPQFKTNGRRHNFFLKNRRRPKNIKNGR